MSKNRNRTRAQKREAKDRQQTSLVYELHGRSVNALSFHDLYGAGLIDLTRKIENGITRFIARLRYRGHTFWLEVETGIAHIKAVLHEPILSKGAAAALRSRLGDMIRDMAVA